MAAGKKSDPTNGRPISAANSRDASEPTIVLKQSMGFAKEYSGVDRVFDSTDHQAQELRAVLTKDAKPGAGYDAMSPVALFTGLHLSCSLLFLTSRANELEQK